MVTNSSIRIQDFVDDARRRSDLAPALATAGSGLQPALMIANEVMNAICRGGPDGQRMNWKWNRTNVIPNPLGAVSGVGGFGTFFTNSWQQDYAVPGVINVDWLEEAPYYNINQVQQPKQVVWASPVRDLSEEYVATGTLQWKICFLPNLLLRYGIWGQTQQTQIAGMNNPGPGVVYTNPLGANLAPNNPCTQIVDQFGNLYVLTQYGTCGGTLPTFPSTVTYPTLVNPSAVATTVVDGDPTLGCVWTAVNPNGFGFRLSCPPPSNSVVWLFRVVAQLIPQRFTSLEQPLGVMPDNMEPFFRAGFEAKCTERHPDAKVRAKALGPEGMTAQWMKALRNAVQASSHEQTDQQLIPIDSWGGGPPQPSGAYPFQGWGGF